MRFSLNWSKICSNYIKNTKLSHLPIDQIKFAVKGCSKMCRYLFFFTIIFVLNTPLCFALPQSDEKKISYSFGVVPQFEQRKIFRIWLPILNELENRTGIHFKLKGSSKIPAFEERFMDGGFDLAYMNPYHLAIASDSQGYVPLIRDGARILVGTLVVSRDSDIKQLSDLQNKAIAFPSPNALGASLLMRAELINDFGIEFVPKYVQTHSSVYLHVVKKLVDAGGGVLGTLESQRPRIKNNLRVLHQTKPITPHPIAVHPRVPVEHQMRIRKALLAIANSTDGRKLFAKIPIDNAISLADYSDIKSWGLEKYYVK